MTLRYDLDWDSQETSISLTLMLLADLTYFSMVWRSSSEATLLITIITSDYSWKIKSTIMSDLMFFKALFKLVI